MGKNSQLNVCLNLRICPKKMCYNTWIRRFVIPKRYSKYLYRQKPPMLHWEPSTTTATTTATATTTTTLLLLPPPPPLRLIILPHSQIIPIWFLGQTLYINMHIFLQSLHIFSCIIPDIFSWVIYIFMFHSWYSFIFLCVYIYIFYIYIYIYKYSTYIYIYYRFIIIIYVYIHTDSTHNSHAFSPREVTESPSMPLAISSRKPNGRDVTSAAGLPGRLT
jgi:hypothetical protein